LEKKVPFRQSDKRVMQYLRATQDLTLTNELDNHPNWWVDSSYAVHPDMHCHIGIYVTLRKGPIKQKLNMKSSTETELVAVDDAMGQILWTQHFLTAQGEYVPTTIKYQDSKCTILLPENGKTSSSKITRHLNVRYYFVTDQIKKGHVKVAFFPTQDMFADFFMKPLQEALFMHMQEKVLNLPTSTALMCTGVCWRIEEKIWSKLQKKKIGKILKILKLHNGEEVPGCHETSMAENTRLQKRLKQMKGKKLSHDGTSL